MDPLRNVARGDRVGPPSAAAHNATMDAVRAHQRRRMGEPVPRRASEDLPGGVVYVQNTGADAPVYGVLRITGVAINAVPGERPVLTAVYGGADAADLAAVAQEPIPANAVGRAIVHGVTWVRANGTGQWANPLGTVLQRNPDGGQAEVLAEGEAELVVVRLSIHPPEGA